MPFRILDDEPKIKEPTSSINKPRSFRILDEEEPVANNAPKKILQGAKEVGKQVANPRNLMQGALGAAKGAIYTSPAAVPAILGEVALPGAIEQSIQEEEEFERDLPPRLRQALDLPKFDPSTARKASKDLLNKVTGGKGILDAAVAAPFTAAGIETEPQTPTEEATKNTVELITALGGPKGFTNLVFDHLPAALKGFFKNKQGALEQMLVGDEPLPKSVYESSQKALAELQANEDAIRTAQKLPQPQPLQSAQSPSLAGRVTQNAEAIGLRPPSNKPAKSIDEDIGRIFSPSSFKNTTEGGKAIKNEVMKLDEAAYRNVNKLYQRSRELNANVEDIHPNLVNSLNEKLEGLQKIPEPSGPQKQLITALENIIGELAEVSEGKIAGYKPISNQTLIDQIQSLRQKVDYDFAHGNAKNIFKPTINDIQSSVRGVAEQSGNKEALQALDEANAAYRDWVTTFDSDYIRPIRDIQNRDYSKMFKGAQDVDEFNELKKILEKSPEGSQISDALKRDLVSKYLGKYSDKPVQSSLKEFNRDLKELEAVISPEQATEVRSKFLEGKKSQTPKFKATSQEQKAAKYLDEKPEAISRRFDTRSGIKEIKKDLNKTENGKEIYDTLRRQKVRDILRENNIEKEFTGNDLYKTLNKRENFELLSELIGEQETEAARVLAKQLGKKQVRKQNIKQIAGHAVALKFLKYVFPLL